MGHSSTRPPRGLGLISQRNNEFDLDFGLGLFRPVGAGWFPAGTHGLRRGLCSFAASRRHPENLVAAQRGESGFFARHASHFLWDIVRGRKARSSTVDSHCLIRAAELCSAGRTRASAPYVGCGGHGQVSGDFTGSRARAPAPHMTGRMSFLFLLWGYFVDLAF